jgi:hypothetical protein
MTIKPEPDIIEDEDELNLPAAVGRLGAVQVVDLAQ